MKYVVFAVLTAVLLVGSILVGVTRSKEDGGPITDVSSIPKLIYDYVVEEDLSIITVHGFDDYLYDNITVLFNGTEYFERHIYAHTIKTHSRSIGLYVELWASQREYVFDGHIDLEEDETAGITVTVTYMEDGKQHRVTGGEDDMPLMIKFAEVTEVGRGG